MDEQRRFYRNISVAPKQSSSIERERGHHRLSHDRLTGRLSFELVTLQPLHVGSGMLMPPETLGLVTDMPLIKAFFRANDALTIPGSSLKGAFRSLVELFTYSCVNKTTVHWSDDSVNDYSECLYNAQRRQGDLCPACKIFGAMGYQGQVRFEDAPQTTGDHELYWIPPQYQPSPNRRHRRYYPYDLSDDREQTWPLEVATVESRFATQAQFTNLTHGEVGLLLIALGQSQWVICPRLGAGKSSGLGAVRINNLVVEKWQVQQAYQSFDSEALQLVDVEACIEAAHPLSRTDVLAKLANDLPCKLAKGE